MNKKILVSGSSKGIGFTIAKKLLEEGNQVVFHSRNRKKLFQLKKNILPEQYLGIYQKIIKLKMLYHKQ